MIATQKSRRPGYAAVVVLDQLNCSSLGRSAFDQILAGRWNCDIYSVLMILRLFNTAHGLDQMARIPMPGETSLVVIRRYTGNLPSIVK
jgi:hypothetical protein